MEAIARSIAETRSRVLAEGESMLKGLFDLFDFLSSISFFFIAPRKLTLSTAAPRQWRPAALGRVLMRLVKFDYSDIA